MKKATKITGGQVFKTKHCRMKYVYDALNSGVRVKITGCASV